MITSFGFTNLPFCFHSDAPAIFSLPSQPPVFYKRTSDCVSPLFKTLSFFLIYFFMVAPAAYGISQARNPESELQLPATVTATAIRDPSLVCDLHHSSRQHWILNPLSGARDRTCVFMATSWVHYC